MTVLYNAIQEPIASSECHCSKLSRPPCLYVKAAKIKQVLRVQEPGGAIGLKTVFEPTGYCKPSQL